MATISSLGKIAYIYDQPTDTWHPVSGTTNTSANFSWSGNHDYGVGAAVSFTEVIRARGGVNNFQNPAARDLAIPAPVNGVVAFVRQDSSGATINQIQYFNNGAWRWSSDSALLSPVSSNITLALSDAGKTIDVLSGNAVTVTVPANSSVAFALGQKVEILRSGSGALSIAPGAGVTINSKNSNLKIAAQYSGAVLIKRDTNTWTLLGDLTA